MDKSGTALRIPASYLNLGYYLVTFTAKIVDNGLSSSVDKFIKVLSENIKVDFLFIFY